MIPEATDLPCHPKPLSCGTDSLTVSGVDVQHFSRCLLLVVALLVVPTYSDAAWKTRILSDNSGFQCSLAPDSRDIPAISYQQAKAGESQLKYGDSAIKPPQITTKSLKNGRSGNKYKVKLKAKDGKKPYRWEVTSGNLPPDLHLAPTGVISGVPIEAGTFVFEVELSDVRGIRRTATFTLTVQ
jgi:hypothetical protein